MKAVIFARVSSAAQEDGVSLDAQLEKLKGYCQEKNLGILETFRVIESSTRGHRKQFHQALKLIEKQKGKIALIVHSTDRLLRGFKEYGLLESLIESGKLEVHVTNERLIVNQDTPWAELLKFDFSILGAKMYVQQLREHVKKAVQYKVNQGKVIGHVPAGYLNQRDPVTGEATVILDPQRAVLVKRLFQEYATGIYSVRELEPKLKEWGLTSPRNPQNYLSRSSIHNILQNPFYYGYMRYQGKLVPHIYPPLIDESLFEKCQQVCDGNRMTPQVKTEKPFVFRGLIRCASCGCTVCSDLKKGKYIYLFCTKAKGKDKCNSQRIREYKAMTVIEAVLDSLVIPEPLLEQIRNHLIEVNMAGQQDYQSVMDNLQQEIKQLEKSKERLLNLYLKGSITDTDYDKKRQQIEKMIQRFTQQIMGNQKNHKEFQDSLVTLLKIISKSAKIFKSSKIDQKRKIIKFLFSNLWLDGENIRYELNKPFDKFANLANDQKWWAVQDSNL